MTELTIKFPRITNLSEQWKYFHNAIQTFKKKRIEFSNQSWDYWIYGSGDKTLIFFHGAMIGPEMFFYPAYTLAERYKVIIPFIPDDFSNIDDLINFYEALVKQESLNHITIIGYSYGGGLAQTLMDIIPEKIDRAVLSHTGLLWGRDKSKGIMLIKIFLKLIPLRLQKKVLLKKRMKDYPNSDWNEFYHQYFSQKIENFKKDTLSLFLNAANKFIKNFQQQTPNERKFKGLVILLGTKGDEDAFYAIDKFRKIFPDSQEYIFKESGGHHFIFLNPKKYTVELYNLLRSTE